MSEFFKILGGLAFVAGLYFIYVAISLPITISPEGTDEVVNLHLMHIQQMNMMLGCVLVISGILVILGACVTAQMSAQTDRLLRDETPPEPPEIYA